MTSMWTTEMVSSQSYPITLNWRDFLSMPTYLIAYESTLK